LVAQGGIEPPTQGFSVLQKPSMFRKNLFNSHHWVHYALVISVVNEINFCSRSTSFAVWPRINIGLN
jgi:hypothetical protein